MDFPEEKFTVVEGIGDDLVWGLGIFVASVVAIFFLLFRWGQASSNTDIHPDSESNVQATRQNLSDQNLRPGGGDTDHVPREHNNGESSCPICLANLAYGIQTNCGHLFCGRCMITYWRLNQWLQAIHCPICRQTVSVLLVSFTREEHAQSNDEKTEIVNQIRNYNRRFSGQPIPWHEYLRDLPTILGHCLRNTFTVSGILFVFRLRVIVCLISAFIYFLSPLDLIPEAAFGLFGLLDDFFVVLLLGIYITVLYRQYLSREGGGNE